MPVDNHLQNKRQKYANNFTNSQKMLEKCWIFPTFANMPVF